MGQRARFPVDSHPTNSIYNPTILSPCRLLDSPSLAFLSGNHSVQIGRHFPPFYHRVSRCDAGCAITSGSHSTQFFHNYRPRVDDSFDSELTSAADQVEQRRRARQDESDQHSLSFLTVSILCCIVGQNESLQVNTDQASLIFFVHSRKACLIFLRCARQD